MHSKKHCKWRQHRDSRVSSTKNPPNKQQEKNTQKNNTHTYTHTHTHTHTHTLRFGSMKFICIILAGPFDGTCSLFLSRTCLKRTPSIVAKSSICFAKRFVLQVDDIPAGLRTRSTCLLWRSPSRDKPILVTVQCCHTTMLLRHG